MVDIAVSALYLFNMLILIFQYCFICNEVNYTVRKHDVQFDYSVAIALVR